jgi:predicted Rossmann fold nucleotide-binding protein DprA/Smf involved in DNA uptake
MSNVEKSNSLGARVAVIESRYFPDQDVVKAFVRSLPADTVVITSGARGVDQ